MKEILDDVLKECDVTLEELKSRRRMEEYVLKRERVSKVLRSMGFTLQSIGDLMNKNHATIINHLQRDKVKAEEVQEIIKKIATGRRWLDFVNN